MKKRFISVIVAVFMVVSFGLAFAGSEADEAKAMVEKAGAYYRPTARTRP